MMSYVQWTRKFRGSKEINEAGLFITEKWETELH